MKVSLGVTIDQNVKNQAQILAKRLGVSLTVVVNEGLKDFIANGGSKILLTHNLTNGRSKTR